MSDTDAHTEQRTGVPPVDHVLLKALRYALNDGRAGPARPPRARHRHSHQGREPGPDAAEHLTGNLAHSRSSPTGPRSEDARPRRVGSADGGRGPAGSHAGSWPLFRGATGEVSVINKIGTAGFCRVRVELDPLFGQRSCHHPNQPATPSEPTRRGVPPAQKPFRRSTTQSRPRPMPSDAHPLICRPGLWTHVWVNQ
jgi:hypothetical protein